jgi:hypothetical protein
LSALLELLRSLKDRGVHLWADGSSLRYRCKDGMLTDVDVQLLSQKRREVIHLLTRHSSTLPINMTASTSRVDQCIQRMHLSLASLQMREQRIAGASAQQCSAVLCG